MWCLNIHVFIVLLSLLWQKLGKDSNLREFILYCETREMDVIVYVTQPQNEAGTVYSFGAQSPLLS